MKKKRMTNAQIKEKMDSIIKSATSVRKEVENTCSYHGDNNRFCKMTTNTKCTNCDFYEPNYATRARIVVEAMMDAEERHKAQMLNMTRMHTDECDELRNKIRFYRTCGTGI